MLDLGRMSSRTCQARSRRAFLRMGTLGALGLSLGDLLAIRALGTAPTAPPARAVILLWLWGGPSHLDTFDPKPDAPLEYRGPFEPIATAVPGVRICELLPGLARRADRFALLRALHHESNDHGVAGTIALTGSIAGAVDLGGQAASGAPRPSTGAIVGRLGRRRPGSLPPYVILGNPLHQGLKRVVGEGGGTLGSTCDPFRLDYEPGVGLKLPDVALPAGVTAARLDARWDLLQRMDEPGRVALGTGSPESLGRHYELAHALIASRQGLAALDVGDEPVRVREAYGPHRFGQCCLIARRLVEAGLPFVQVNWSTHVECPEDAGDGGWDMHDRYFQIMQDRHGWMLDRALSALLDDLRDRGLLDSTLVVAVGEFGRTPKINDKAGRDHWNPCYAALLAGGGIAGGRVVGASDRRGEHPADRPATPADLGATILARLGIGAAELTGIGLNPMGQPIEELF
ncbi:MAG TPA: DUF1501 domain-containing protein [Isosphaeraceae bacterium]